MVVRKIQLNIEEHEESALELLETLDKESPRRGYTVGKLIRILAGYNVMAKKAGSTNPDVVKEFFDNNSSQINQLVNVTEEIKPVNAINENNQVDIIFRDKAKTVQTLMDNIMSDLDKE